MSTPFFTECPDCKREFRIEEIPPRCPYCGAIKHSSAVPKGEAAVPSPATVR
jgi:Zn finger protein HypA/HybF involved in hydrogenase expression